MTEETLTQEQKALLEPTSTNLRKSEIADSNKRMGGLFEIATIGYDLLKEENPAFLKI